MATLTMAVELADMVIVMRGRRIAHFACYVTMVGSLAACSSSPQPNHLAVHAEGQQVAIGMLGGGEVGGDTGGGGDVAADNRTTPWIYRGITGVTIRTTHYRIHTNSRNHALVTALPDFCEQAYRNYQQYTESRTHSKYDFDAMQPVSRMDVYVLANRRDWEQLTNDLLVERAETLIRLNRGGFTTRGTSVYYDIGYEDTLAIAAHEGWHQFVQMYFKDPLPVWLDEGIACEMESLALESESGEIKFQQKHNPTRMVSLIAARNSKQILNISELLSEAPADFIRKNGSAATSNYYAQAWALTRFLDEYKHGRYRKSLRRLLRAALSGNFSNRMSSVPPTHRLMSTQLPVRSYSPCDIFRVYINDDLDEVNREYLEFINSLR